MITAPGGILPGAECVQLPRLGPDESQRSAGSCQEPAVEGATLLCLGGHERGELGVVEMERENTSLLPTTELFARKPSPARESRVRLGCL